MGVEVSIIVVTWNARELVDRCLEAATGRGSAGVDVEVIVVDNASDDDTVAHVRAAWPQVRVVETGRNGGMAAGNNTGMSVAAGRAFLLLNSDCFLDDGAVRALLDRLDEPLGSLDDEQRRIGVVVPRLHNADGTLQRSVRGWPSPWRLATEFLFLRRLLPRARWANAFYAAGHDYERASTVEWATGACLLVSRDVVDEVGLMDESYFMYGEEVDWLARMAAEGVGLSVAYEPSAGAVHLGGGSAGRAWGRMYARQCENHVVLQARIGGVRAARRARRVVLAGLYLRIMLTRLRLLRPPADRTPAEQLVVLREAVAAVRGTDPSAPPPRVIPHLEPTPAVQRPAADPR